MGDQAVLQPCRGVCSQPGVKLPEAGFPVALLGVLLPSAGKRLLKLVLSSVQR